MKEHDTNEMMSPFQVQRFLGIGRTKVYELLGTSIPVYILGDRCLRARRSEVEDWLQDQKRHPSEEESANELHPHGLNKLTKSPNRPCRFFG